MSLANMLSLEYTHLNIYYLKRKDLYLKLVQLYSQLLSSAFYT